MLNMNFQFVPHCHNNATIQATSLVTYFIKYKIFFNTGYVNTVLHGRLSVLPARGVAEVALAEHDAVEGRGEGEVHDHPRLLARHVQPRDLRHCARTRALPHLAPQRLNLAADILKIFGQCLKIFTNLVVTDLTLPVLCVGAAPGCV